jgi:hypothetical protein
VHRNSVRFLDIDALWTLIEQYLPFQANLQKLEEVQQDYSTWDSHYRLDTRIDGAGIHHTLAEKFPGASQEKPLNIHSTISIRPDTEEAIELQKALARFIETGSRVRIPGSYVENLEYPEILQGIFPAMTKDGFLEFGSLPHPKPLLLRAEICCDDGNEFVLEYLHLICIGAGKKEATLTNDDQPIPFRVELVLHADTSTWNIQFSLKDGPMNAYLYFRYLQLVTCLSKPHTIRLTNLEIGRQAGLGRNERGLWDAPDPDIMEGFAALAALQRKSDRMVMIPDRDFTDEERCDIAELLELFRTGKLSGTCDSASLTIMVTDDNREEVRQSLEPLLGESGGCLFLQEEEIFTLFGEQYPLGPIKLMSLPAKLINWSEVKLLLDHGYSGKLSLQVVPSDDGHFTKEFVQWPGPVNYCGETPEAVR